jgi:hypothetical protein
VGQGTRFFFQRADAEIRRVAPIGQIFRDKRFQTAAPFALGHVNELMQKQLAVSPAIRPDDNPVADGDAARRIRDDLRPASGIRQFDVVRQRNAIDDQNTDPLGLRYAGSSGVGGLGGIERNAVLEDVRFLERGPREGQWHEAIKVVLVNHT